MTASIFALRLIATGLSVSIPAPCGGVDIRGVFVFQRASLWTRSSPAAATGALKVCAATAFIGAPRFISTVQTPHRRAMMLFMSDLQKRQGSTLIPSVRYRDAHAAIEWLVRVFGFHKQAVYDGPDGTVAHAQLTLGKGMVMLGSASNPSPHPQFYTTPDELGGRVTSPTYVIVPDCGPVYASAQAAAAEIVQELQTMDYGGKAFTIRDPEGYLWSVGEYDPWVPEKGA